MRRLCEYSAAPSHHMLVYSEFALGVLAVCESCLGSDKHALPGRVVKAKRYISN